MLRQINEHFHWVIYFLGVLLIAAVLAGIVEIERPAERGAKHISLAMASDFHLTSLFEKEVAKRGVDAQTVRGSGWEFPRPVGDVVRERVKLVAVREMPADFLESLVEIGEPIVHLGAERRDNAIRFDNGYVCPVLIEPEFDLAYEDFDRYMAGRRAEQIAREASLVTLPASYP